MSLQEVKRYLCPISGGKWEKCLDCPGKCNAGLRYLALIEKQTQPDRKPEKKPHKEGSGSVGHLRARAACAAAIESGYPIRYIMEHNEVNFTVAKERIRRYVLMYPDLWEGREELARAEIPPRKYREHDEESLQMLREALKTEKPARYIMEKRGIQERSAFNWIRIWKDKARREGIILTEQQISAEMVTETTAEAEEDEVSLEDFLDELKPAEPKSETRSPMDAALNEKYEQLNAEKKRLLEEIREREERVKWIEEKQGALASVSTLFR